MPTRERSKATSGYPKLDLLVNDICTKANDLTSPARELLDSFKGINDDITKSKDELG